ncbi:hypothetical protein [Yinghuangia soli]|uniref:Uncharacterized protein n=1 Tax=Yinghuangia soli TaxID=2908204 RepID=A0AA41PY46_9ACTN|nr:hypothetical protein [Yinghuangia soli]MCF2527831.1 hypothetical protein [Yinghuangia soli]
MPKTAVVIGPDRRSGGEVAAGLAELLGTEATVRSITDTAKAVAFAHALAAAGKQADIVVAAPAAGIEPGVRMADQVAAYLDANNGDLHLIMNAYLPVLADGARFVVVSSTLGSLDHLPLRLRGRFDGFPEPSQASPGAALASGLAHLDEVLAAYAEAVAAGTAAAEGWPAWIEVASRVGQIAAMRCLARALADVRGKRDLLVGAVCADPDTAGVALDEVLWAATLPPGTREPYGRMLKHRTAMPFAYAG